MASEQQQQQQQQQLPSQTQQNTQQNVSNPATQQTLSRSSPQQQQQQHALPQQQQHSALPQQTELLSHSNAAAAAERLHGSTAATAAPNVLEQQQQQFCLRWNNFQSNIVNSFESLLNKEELVDVTLTAEGKSLRAHRVLLSACSPYFSDLFKDLPSHQHPVIVLRDTRFLELKCLLCFIYHGEVNVSQDNLSCLLNLAENLKVKGLAQEAPKRHNSKDYEYGGRRGLSPEREEDLSDGGEGLTPKHRGRLLRSEESNSPSPASHSGFPSYPALGSLLGSKNPGSSMDDRNSARDIRETHLSKGVAMSHDRHQPLMHQDRQQQQAHQYSPPSKRRKRLSSPHQGQSPVGHNSSSSSQVVQQQSCGSTNQNSSRGHSHVSPPPTNPSMHNNSSSSSAHTPAEETNSHAVNLTVCQGSPPRLMIPKVEFIPSEEDSGNGDKERMERQEQRERVCNFFDKERIAGMISSKFSGGVDSDMEGEEEPPPPHHDEDSGDMDSHTPSGLPLPLSHQLPPGLQQSFVPYPQTTHAAAAAAAAAAAHHIANTFTPGPSGVASSVSPGGWRSSHSSDQTPSSPQDAVTGDTMSALENLVDSLSSDVAQQTNAPASRPKNDASPQDAGPTVVPRKIFLDRPNFNNILQEDTSPHAVKLGLEPGPCVGTGAEGMSYSSEVPPKTAEKRLRSSGSVASASKVQFESRVAESNSDLISEELDIIAKEECLDLEEEFEVSSAATESDVAKSTLKSEDADMSKNNVSNFSDGLNVNLHDSKTCETGTTPRELQNTNYSILPSGVAKDNFFRRSLFKNSIEISPVSSCGGWNKNTVIRKGSSSRSVTGDTRGVSLSVNEIPKEDDKTATEISDDNDDLVIIDDKNKMDVDPLLFLADTPMLSSSDNFDIPIYNTDSNSFFSPAPTANNACQLQTSSHADGASSLALCPSRQSCLCPLCGRLIAQRRSLKQHLMSSYHKLTLLEAEITVKTCNFSSQR